MAWSAVRSLASKVTVRRYYKAFVGGAAVSTSLKPQSVVMRTLSIFTPLSGSPMLRTSSWSNWSCGTGDHVKPVEEVSGASHAITVVPSRPNRVPVAAPAGRNRDIEIDATAGTRAGRDPAVDGVRQHLNRAAHRVHEA